VIGLLYSIFSKLWETKWSCRLSRSLR
jgi:hypothetical protein